VIVLSLILSRNEWHLDQGLVGYKRILENVGISVQMTEEGIIFQEEHLEKFPYAFFYYFIDKYSVKKREEAYIRPLWYKYKSGDLDAKKEIEKRLKDQLSSKVVKYFANTPEGSRLIGNIEKLRQHKDYSEEQEELLEEIFADAGVKEIDEKLTSNYFKAVILGPYFGQVSFLNVVKNDLTIAEQRDLLKKDFVQPVLEELQFIRLLEVSTDPKEVLDFLEGVNHKGLQALKRPFKKMNVEEMNIYVHDNVNKCSFFDDLYGFEQFNEGVFSPLALSASNSINFSWHSHGKVSIPISSLAKLILLCAPAGATITGSRSIFVQNEGTFAELVQINDHYSNEKNRDKAFDEIIFDLAREQKLKADYTMKQYLILEYESDYQSKKTILDYMVLTPELCRLFNQQEKEFSYLSSHLRNGLIHDLLNHVDLKYRLFSELREKIKYRYSPMEIVYGAIIRHLYQCYQNQKGVSGMSVDTKKQSKKVWNLYFSGAEIQQAIGEKKAQGIAYRLLNAAKAGDKKQFMDTIMRIYISAEKQMPASLLNVLHEDEMDFATVADAWIAGLISRKNEKGDDQNESK